MSDDTVDECELYGRSCGLVQLISICRAFRLAVEERESEEEELGTEQKIEQERNEGRVGVRVGVSEVVSEEESFRLRDTQANSTSSSEFKKEESGSEGEYTTKTDYTRENLLRELYGNINDDNQC